MINGLNSKKSPVNACSLISEYIIPADAPYPNYNVQAKNLTIAKKTNPRFKISKCSGFTANFKNFR